jgi:hypothetical protein
VTLRFVSFGLTELNPIPDRLAGEFIRDLVEFLQLLTIVLSIAMRYRH